VFEPAHTPCCTGRIPEAFRGRPDAVRSCHPTHSVAAIGADAELLTRDHIDSLTPCDELSPYGKLAARDDSFVLLIGVGLDVNTTFHHVEEIAGAEYQMQRGFARATILVDGAAVHRHILLHKYGTPRNFAVMEPVFEELSIQRRGTIGAAEVRLIAARRMVEVTLRCIRANPRILCATST
jgi:aminoglycoside 3-N-acetyltransferase